MHAHAKRVSVRVQPNRKREEVIEQPRGSLVVAVREQAREGKANRAVMKALARHFGIAANQVRLIVLSPEYLARSRARINGATKQ